MTLNFGYLIVFSASNILLFINDLVVYDEAARKKHFSEGGTERGFVLLFELADFLGKFPRVSAGTSLLSCSLFWRSLLKFHSEGDFADE